MKLRTGIYHPDKQSINICFRYSERSDLSECIDPITRKMHLTRQHYKYTDVSV